MFVQVKFPRVEFLVKEETERKFLNLECFSETTAKMRKWDRFCTVRNKDGPLDMMVFGDYYGLSILD